MRTRLKQTAASLGLPFGECERAYNSRLAQELGKWAEEQGRAEAYQRTVYDAYFVQGRNIARVDVLLDIAREACLSSNEAGRVIEARLFSQRVDEDWARCRRMGIRAVPTFVLGSEQLVGAQPYAMLERFVETNGVPAVVSAAGPAGGGHRKRQRKIN